MEKVDADLAEAERVKGCRHCSGKLHRANYKRKPRGVESWPDAPLRDSFCCDQEGCRRRHTPPSVRFLGRRVYGGVVAVLFPAMVHGLKPERVRHIREALKLKIEWAHAGALATMVVGRLCRQLVLERGSRPVPAAALPEDTPLVAVFEFSGRGASRPVAGFARLPGSAHHSPSLEGVGYVRLGPSPAEDAG